MNCHNFSESKVKVETGGLKLSYCSQTSLSRNGWPKAVILLVITVNKCLLRSSLRDIRENAPGQNLSLEVVLMTRQILPIEIHGFEICAF